MEFSIHTIYSNTFESKVDYGILKSAVFPAFGQKTAHVRLYYDAVPVDTGELRSQKTTPKFTSVSTNYINEEASGRQVFTNDRLARIFPDPSRDRHRSFIRQP